MSDLIEQIFTTFKAGYCTDSELYYLLRDCGNSFNVVARLVGEGILVRLKRGFFVFGNKLGLPQAHPFVIANLLYGPSYVSLESALSHYGLIPEGVRETTSVALTKPKLFRTPIGRVSYRKVRAQAFADSVLSEQGAHHRYLIAEREKAVL